MGAALALHEGRQRLLLIVFLLLVIIADLRLLGIDRPPSRVEYLLTGHLELYPIAFLLSADNAQYGCCRELAVGIEHADEAARHQVVDVPFHIGQVLRDDLCGDDGMVVGHLRGVEHALGLGQRLATQRPHQLGIDGLPTHLGLKQAVHHLRTLGVDVVAQELGVDTRIGGQLALVKRLDGVQCHLGTHAELTVAVHLQRCQVVELLGSLLAVFLLHLGHGERLIFDQLEALLALFLACELTFGGGEECVTVDGREHPIGLGLEIVYLFLAVNDQCQRGRLHTTDAQHLPVLPVFQRVEARGVHAQQPVANGARQARHVERLIVLLVFQLPESLADGLIGHRRYPQPLHGTGGLCLLHHPALYQLSFLAGITTVDDAVGLLHQPFNHRKLFLNTLVFNQFNAKPLWYHGQGTQCPAKLLQVQ